MPANLPPQYSKAEDEYQLVQEAERLGRRVSLVQLRVADGLLGGLALAGGVVAD